MSFLSQLKLDSVFQFSVTDVDGEYLIVIDVIPYQLLQGYSSEEKVRNDSVKLHTELTVTNGPCEESVLCIVRMLQKLES